MMTVLCWEAAEAAEAAEVAEAARLEVIRRVIPAVPPVAINARRMDTVITTHAIASRIGHALHINAFSNKTALILLRSICTSLPCMLVPKSSSVIIL
jgi:hypothetical protein